MSALSDTAVRNAKPTQKPRKLSDGRGLYLLITPAGGKLWRFKYRFDGKEKLLALGVYPEVSLKLARQRREEAREQLAQDIDPMAARQAAKAATEHPGNFEAVTREWFTRHSSNWAPSHSDKIIRRFERDVFPWLGTRPVGEITAPELLAVVRRIEERGSLETAHRALQTCGQVFRYAVATGRALRDPTGDLRGALPPARGSHFAAVTEPTEVGTLLRALDKYSGTFTVCCALRLAPLVFVRPGELRTALWSDIDLTAGLWSYEVPKTGTAHVVPLSSQAVSILQELQPLTGRSRYVFPSARSADRPMSENAVLAALRRLGIPKDQMSGHGFRAMARTILDEILGFRPEWIEQQLAHAVRDPLGRAYNRTAHLEGRRTMMQSWSDYLDQLKTGAAVVQLCPRAG